jgi:hypothetical protein
MRAHRTGDLWTDAGLLRVEEMLASERAITARRALRREAGSSRRTVRVWLGTALLAGSLGVMCRRRTRPL